MGGMAAYLRDHAPDPERTFVLGLDTLGAGTPVQLRAEGVIRAHAYDERDLDRVDAAAAAAGLPAPPRWRLGGWTDPILARFGGIPAVSILSMGGGMIPEYHRPTDTPERVDWGCVDACLALARAVAQNWGWRFSRNALTPSAKSAERGAALLRDDLELERRGERRARGRVHHPLGERRPRSARRPAARPRAASTAASSSSAGATRLARPIRSASSAADQLAGHDQLLGPAEADDLRQPRGAADVGDQPDPRLGQPDDRVGGEHAEVARERQLERAADARALDLADDGLGHLLGEVPRLQAGAAERPQPLGRRRERGERAEVHARGEHRAVAADDDAADVRVVGGGAQRRARGEHQLVVERVALLRPVQDDVADGTAIF